MPELVVILSTCPDAASAERIARALVEERLAACVNCVPGLRSFYRWQEQIQADAEVLLVIKSAADRFEAVEALVRKLHPYELPELIAVPLTTGSAPYLAWLRAEIGER
ncbi:MAG TPA: divalent-cation tolerance protein CutA [Gammaproteobacteria bacterium]|jgi:periplasmic divalent cation tolerance protein|nr:divalent-cation tolerance protein CutA [Gammaproteobacteria bacterium]